MDYPLVSILIVTWNRKDEVVRAIRSAQAQSYPNTEIVVIDNNSQDGTFEIVNTSFPGITCVRTSRNLGCPSGRNFGFQHCRGKYIYMLDDDGWLAPDAVTAAVGRAESEPRLGVVMSRIHEVKAGTVVKERPENLNEPAYTSTFSGGCSLLRRAALREVGGFPEDFFRQGEESDLALRLLQKGYFCFLEPGSVMFHAPSPQGRSSKSSMYFTLRNGNRTALRLWPFPWCLLKPLVSLLHAVRFGISLQYYTLPFEIINMVLLDILRMRWLQGPRVSFRTFRVFRELSRVPSAIKPSI